MVSRCTWRIPYALLLFLAGSITRSLADGQARAKLAFGVMVYQKKEYSAEQTFTEFSRLMDGIYVSDRHVYVFHIDSKSDATLFELIQAYCESHNTFGNANYRFIEPRDVAWGGLSTGEMMLALMQEAYESDIAWDHFVLIGHESVPLTSLQYAEAYIASFPSDTNFIHCMDVGGYDFFGQWENANGRLTRIVVESYAPEGNTLIENIDIPRRIPWRKNMKFYKSIQLVVLSRDAIRYLCYGPNTRRVMLFLANVKTSDEMLIPTLLQMNRTLAVTATCNTTLHFTHWIRPGGSWHPEYLTLENLPQLMNTSELYARKFRGEVSDSLIEVFEKIRNDHLTEFRVGLQNLLYREESLNLMAWLVPIIRDYLQEADRLLPPRTAQGLPDEYENLRSVFSEELAKLEISEVNTMVDVNILSLQEHLFSLDRIRRARDLIETEKFFEYIRRARAWKDREDARLKRMPEL